MGITIHLFGKPAWHLDEGQPVPPEKLRLVGNDIKARCDEAADMVEKLTAAGWELALTLYSIDGYHPVHRREADIKAHLATLGIAENQLGIDDFLDEEDEFLDEDYEDEEDDDSDEEPGGGLRG